MLRLMHVVLLIAMVAPAVAQQAESPHVNVCVVTLGCSGSSCSNAIVTQRLVRDLNSRVGRPAIHAQETSGSCSNAERQCKYVVALLPTVTDSWQPNTETPVASSAVPKYIPATSAAGFADTMQQPLDQASLYFQLYRTDQCQYMRTYQVSKLEASPDSPSKESIEWLTSKAAEKIQKEVRKDKK